MNRFQKFLCVVDKHEKTDFLLKWLFWLQPFFDKSLRSHGSKHGRSQKSHFNKKISFFMLFNHVKEFLKFVHTENLFSQLFAWAFTSVHIVTGTFTSKLFNLISSFWHDLPKNHWFCYIPETVITEGSLLNIDYWNTLHPVSPDSTTWHLFLAIFCPFLLNPYSNIFWLVQRFKRR